MSTETTKYVEVTKDVESTEVIYEANTAGMKLQTFASIRRNKSTRASSDMKWVNVNFRSGKKNILKDCWGDIPAKHICAIMGPSGAGKSSLLNVLAGRSAPAPGIEIEGEVTVGDKMINPVAYRQNIAYVMQDDALMATATPREALRFSASLRLPATTTDAELDSMVETMLGMLGIEGCADVLIGGALIKGISGGQKKRTSVGVELITDPTLLFLDEPTSGLDSSSACSLIMLLKEVAQNDCTILCTIHQPSSEVFFLFDLVIFMNQGRIFYQGPVNKIVQHFAGFDYNCPKNYNPSDFVMALTQSESTEILDKKGVFMPPPPELVSHGSSRLDVVNVEFKTESSFGKQMVALAFREFVGTYRNTGALAGRFGVTIFLNLLFGLIFLNAANKGNANTDDFNNHFGSVAMVVISGMFGSAQPILLSFPFERPLFLREFSTGTYGVIPYFASKLLMEAPLSFMQTLCQFILCYFMLGMQGQFIYIVLACWGLGMCAGSVAVCLGCVVKDVKDAQELVPLLFVPQMLFLGFFVPTSKIPVFLSWAQYLCSIKYAMNIVLITEFDLALSSCQGQDAHDNCKSVLTGNNIVTSQWWLYMVLLFVLFLSFRVVGVVILVQKAKRFY